MSRESVAAAIVVGKIRAWKLERGDLARRSTAKLPSRPEGVRAVFVNGVR